MSRALRSASSAITFLLLTACLDRQPVPLGVHAPVEDGSVEDSPRPERDADVGDDNDVETNEQSGAEEQGHFDHDA